MIATRVRLTNKRHGTATRIFYAANFLTFHNTEGRVMQITILYRHSVYAGTN